MRLSPSKLSVLKDCERCFWLANKMGIERPRGIFPSLPGGMDLKLKDNYDAHRSAGTKPLCVPDGFRLFSNIEVLKKWRHWRTGLSCEIEGTQLIGALDDVLVDDSGRLIPYDYKTKGSEPKNDGSQYYQTQLDCYDLLLTENGYETAGIAFLAYYYPVSIGNPYGNDEQTIYFGVKVFKLETSAQRAREIIQKAKAILEGGMPKANPDCEYCKYEYKKIEKVYPKKING